MPCQIEARLLSQPKLNVLEVHMWTLLCPAKLRLGYGPDQSPKRFLNLIRVMLKSMMIICRIFLLNFLIKNELMMHFFEFFWIIVLFYFFWFFLRFYIFMIFLLNFSETKKVSS